MSVGSCDESSNLVKDTASPSPLSSNLTPSDDVFDFSSSSSAATNDATSTSTTTTSSSSSSTSTPCSTKGKHSSPFKKSKAPKGLGFLIKAREGARKSRSKSPSKHKSKKHADFDFDLSELAPEGGDAHASGVDDSVKAKSEHWQAFLQMQDRIKENVLKTQSSIGKLSAGRISPSGRISPGRDDQDSRTPAALSDGDTGSGTFLANQEEPLGKECVETTWQPQGPVTAAKNPKILISNPFLSGADLESGIATAPMESADPFGDGGGMPFEGAGSKRAADNAATALAGGLDEFDLLGLNSDLPPPVTNNHHATSGQSSFCDDLLGLDDFLSQPASRELSQDNLQAMDWFGASTQSSAQSSLCPSPVQFDLDLLTSQGRLAPDSTAVSDLARSLVDDFLQWGAGQADAPPTTLSKNPFSSDDPAAEEHALKPNAFNPFATIVESDDADSAADLTADHQRRESLGLEQPAAFTGFDPFAPVTETSAEPLDPFLDINANNAASATAPAAPAAPALGPSVHVPAQAHGSKKASRKQSNPFLITEDDFVDGAVTFDDDFFASRGIFHAAPSKDLDSIWGTGADSGQSQTGLCDTFSPGAAANPFQGDAFTAENVVGSEQSGGLEQSVNPFLTASFENIASQSQPAPLAADNPFAAMLGEDATLAPLEPVLLEPSDPPPAPRPALADMDFDPFSPQPSSTNGDIPAANHDLSSDLLGEAFGLPTTDPPPAVPTVPAVPLAEPPDDDDDFFSPKIKLDIREKSELPTLSGPVPMLPPPPKAPKSPQMPHRENPFDKASPPEENFASFAEVEEELRRKNEAEAAASSEAAREARDRLKSMTSEDSTPEEEGPLSPLEPFHAASDTQRDCWRLMVRHPTKKKLAGNRFWKLTIVRLGVNKDGPVLRLFMEDKDTEPVQELPLQPCYSISDVSMQQYDQFGKIHTVKIQYVFYRERVGLRPERITPSFVRKPKPNMILDHAPQVSELLKLGSLDLHEVDSLVWALEDALMRLPAHRDKPLSYSKDEVQAEVWDEYSATIDKTGSVTSQKARVRIFFLAFLTGMPACELGISDRRRKGKEVVGRHDIIPVRTEDWIRIESPEFHHVVDMDTYERTHNIRFHPLDACQFELVRFRVRPRDNRELPLQLRVTQTLKALHYEVRVDLLVTGYHAFSKKCGQFPCEDIEVRIKIPEPWIYYFRYEKRFGYGSLKAVARKPGRIKGLERITMMAQGLLTPALMEASVGSAKYEHLYRAVVWRIPRLPERNHG
ncbi:hypothetical protein EGW08_016135, partial [Elysia chlorotica]